MRGVLICAVALLAPIGVAFLPLHGSSGNVHWAAAITATFAIVTAAGALYAAKQVLEARKARQAALLADISRRWDGELLRARQALKDRTPEEVHVYYEALRATESREYFLVQRLPNYFEDLAALEAHGIIDIKLIDDTLGASVMRYWKAWSIEASVTREKYPLAWTQFEGLAGKIAERRGEAGKNR